MKHSAVAFLLLATLSAPAVAQDHQPTFPEAQPFDPAQWTTAKDYPAIGDPQARRDSDETFRVVWDSFPPTLRTDGPNSNLVQTATIHGLMYESLVQIHPNTEDHIPFLASHWRIETDEQAGKQTFWFRINEKARWADGSEVTADDVHKSWWHRVQEDRSDPSNVMTFKEGYEEPVVVDKYTIKVSTKELNWRLFLYFGGMAIYPAKSVHIPGEEFLTKYNWEFMPGSGPYKMASPDDLKKGDSLTITRRADWWAKDEPWAQNLYNFKRIKFMVVRDVELEYEMFKKGELTHFRVSRAQRWVEEVPQEEIVKKGWVKARKIYNQSPQGFAGFAFNMREWPFDDPKVRLAFSYLFNREKLMEKLFFNEYDYIDSYFPGRDWGNGKQNEKIRFDPDKAAELLDEAGYTEEDADGVLKDAQGRRLELTFEFYPQSFERVWLVVQKDFEDNGIKLNLKLIDGATLIKKVTERQFKLHFQSWGALLFPNPETSWRSDLADQPANNNITGFKSPRVDELCKQYNVTFDRAKQKEITREVDKLVFEQHPYALGWYANFQRLLYWDKFGHPANYFTRIGQVPDDELILRWWFDPDKDAALKKAMASGQTLPQGEMVVRPWE